MNETIVDRFESFERRSKERSTILTREHSMEKNCLREVDLRQSRTPEEQTTCGCLRNVENSLEECGWNGIVDRKDRRRVDERINREHLDDCREH